MGNSASSTQEDERKLLTDVHHRSGFGTSPGDVPDERELVAAINVLGLKLLGILGESTPEPGGGQGPTGTFFVSPPLISILICAAAAAASLDSLDKKLIPELSTVAEELIDLVTVRPRGSRSATPAPHHLSQTIVRADPVVQFAGPSHQSERKAPEKSLAAPLGVLLLPAAPDRGSGCLPGRRRRLPALPPRARLRRRAPPASPTRAARFLSVAACLIPLRPRPHTRTRPDNRPATRRPPNPPSPGARRGPVHVVQRPARPGHLPRLRRDPLPDARRRGEGAHGPDRRAARRLGGAAQRRPHRVRFRQVRRGAQPTGPALRR